VQPKLFFIFPEARDEIRQWANQNLESLNSDLAADHICTVILPKLFLQYSEESAIDRQPTQQEFMRWLHVSMIDTSTAFRCLKNLGFCFDILKKDTITIVTKIQKMFWHKKSSFKVTSTMNSTRIVGYRFPLMMPNNLNQKLIQKGLV